MSLREIEFPQGLMIYGLCRYRLLLIEATDFPGREKPKSGNNGDKHHDPIKSRHESSPNYFLSK